MSVYLTGTGTVYHFCDRFLLLMSAKSLLQLIGAKVKYAQEQGLCLIPCVGETLQEREQNRTCEVIFRQMSCIAGVRNLFVLLLLYQPVCLLTMCYLVCACSVLDTRSSGV